MGVEYDNWNDSMTEQQYYAWTERWMASCYEALCDGGRICINVPFIGFQRKSEELQTYVDKYIPLLRKVGFKMREFIIWVKSDGLDPNHFSGDDTSWGSWQSPNAVYIRTFSECILVAFKGNPTRGRKEKNDITKEEFLTFTKNAWFFPSENDRSHPAPYPEELPTRLIKLYTWPGDVVADPFCGSGTTLLAAEKLGRNWLGIDISEKYCKEALKRVDRYRYQEKLTQWLPTAEVSGSSRSNGF